MSGWSSRALGWLSLVVFGLLPAPQLPAAAPGVTAKAVVFGQSACFSGPNRQLGLHYRAGIRAAFAERNALGGVDGRSLELISLDDGYEPDRAAANAERFTAKDDVLAVIGGVGTPTAKRIVPVLRSAGIPFVGHVTGADFLGDYKRNPHIVNLRASYLQELRVLVDHVVRKGGKKRLGIIYQDDAFGRSVLRNYQTVLKEHGIHILAKSAFSRNTHAVHAGLFTLAKADLDAILIVGSYAANSEIINLANGLGHEYIIGNLSFVLSSELRKRVEAPSDRILVTEVMPDPTDTGRGIVRSYQRALRAASESGAAPAPPVFNELSLEGYILGRFVITVLERMEGELTRERFLRQALASDAVLIDDWKVEFRPGTNVGAEFVRLTDLGGREPAKGESGLEKGR